ncbi:hypothetical protein CRV01_12105 [Arcobacter sp. CECT 8983]|uniref:hypothetical protein n=1 Tax=Arcobacter sp. CECT 8983 TaxID=2044508 RepID=UPI00100A3B88|nr:hypothetical protein [Arcobacter sp. CECT 8983]RXJ88484.1 hypothetical protein CRV01_12105 [Arcobacter sp. CECT 8983]
MDIATIENICKCFSDDLTASEASQKVNISRVTINKYYKKLRTFITNKQEKANKNKPRYFYLKYFVLNKNYIFYIEYNNEIVLLKEFDLKIDDEVKNSLIRNRKINCAKLLLKENNNKYIVLGYMSTKNRLNDFINSRLKKFRGINKTNIETHIKESIFRFNNSNSSVFTNLTTIFL